MATKILVVDDHEATRWCMVEELARSGFEVDQASDTEEACAAVDNKDYDLIISDVVMPGTINGIEFGKLLKEHGAGAVTIAMSGLDVAEQCVGAGYSYFLCKPFSAQELLKAVNDAITKQVH
jgi:DNA-binding NtrC family response regulator